jgi:multidrug efflux pump subunit AcrB
MGATIPGARILFFNPPAIVGMSSTGGFEGYVQNRGVGDFHDLNRQLQALMAEASKRPELTRIMTAFAADTPQYRVDVDNAKAYAMGVDTSTIFRTMQATFGDFYVNDFNRHERTYQVKMQSEPSFRMTQESLKEVYVRSVFNEMIPLSSLVSLQRILGPDTVERFNVFPAAKVTGEPAPGYTSGQAIAAMEEVAARVLESDFTLDWIGSAFQEKQITRSSAIAFVLGLMVVYLILSAQYERWTLPVAVIMAVPFALFGAITLVWLRGLANDIYFQIALVTLVGLAAKNAILIVEFAHHTHMEKGGSLKEAALAAARLRFRPIIMTSLAFIFGCLPLVVSSGAGAASRHSIGTGVVGGMITATVIAPIFVPLFYAGIMKAPALIFRKLLRISPAFSKKKGRP